MPHLRTGKIARLPVEIRTQLNRRLQNGSSLVRLLPWLNALPEVKAAMKEYFHSRPILRQNLSEWTQGGYQDWLHQQSPNDLSHCLTEDIGTFTSTHPPLTDTLNHWSATRLALRTRRINALSETDPEAADQLLTKMIRDLTTLQQSQIRARREQRQRDHLAFQQDLARQKTEATREKTDADHERWALHPDNHDRIDALWKKAYPDDYYFDEEEDTDDESDAPLENETPAPGHPERSAAWAKAACGAQSKDPVPSSSNPHPSETSAPAPITPMSPTPRHESERVFDHTSGTYITYDDDDDDNAGNDSAMGHLPSAIPSSTPDSPRKPTPTDSSREFVARLLWPKAFAKHGLAVFDHLPFVKESEPRPPGLPAFPCG